MTDDNTPDPLARLEAAARAATSDPMSDSARVWEAIGNCDEPGKHFWRDVHERVTALVAEARAEALREAEGICRAKAQELGGLVCVATECADRIAAMGEK